MRASAKSRRKSSFTSRCRVIITLTKEDETAVTYRGDRRGGKVQREVAQNVQY